MKLKVIVVGVVMALAFYCTAAFAADGDYSKVGLINIQKILVESKSGKEAKAVYQKDLEAKRAALASKENTARALESELKSDSKKLKAADRKKKEDQLAVEIKELRRVEQDMKDELKKKDSELTSKILTDVLEITKKIGDERGYSIILQGGPQVVYMGKGVDITDEVLKKYDFGK